MAKILIEDGEKLDIKALNGIRTPKGEDSLKNEWKTYRDNYWGKDLSKFNDNHRDGTCIPYNEFFDRVIKSEIGIHLQINNFDDPNKVEVWTKQYDRSDLEKDIVLISKKGDPNKLIITRRSLLEAKENWDKVKFDKKNIRIGVGANACGNPVVFILLADKDCITNESNNPIRFPPQS